MLRYLVAFTGGAAAVLGFAPFRLPALTVLSIAVLFHQWSDAGPRRSFALGWWFGLGMFGVGASWVYVSLHVYGNMPPPLATFTVFLFVAYLALFPATVGWVQARFRGVGLVGRMVWLVPALWALAEWLRGWLLSGFPWLSLGYSQVDLPLAGYAPLLGVYGVSWLVAVTAGLLVAALRAPRRHALWLVAAAAVIWAGGWAAGQREWVYARGPALRVALVQGNVPLAQKWSPSQRASILRHYLELSDGLDVRLVVWPEGALPYHADELPDALWQKLRAHPADFLFGIFERGQHDGRNVTYNSVVGVGEHTAFYRKRHLVPFGEFIPLRPLLGWVLRYLHIPMNDLSAWDGVQKNLRVAGVEVGMSVCYEDAFPADVRAALPAANMLVNVSEDAWFGDSLGPHQRLQMAQMRALETGRPMLRAANTGISALIDYRGRIAQQAPQFEVAVLSGEVQPTAGATPYVRYGDVPLAALILVVLIVPSAARAARTRRAPGAG